MVSNWGDTRLVVADAAGLRRAAEQLRSESVCAFPTETVYGLGAHAFSTKAVTEIYRLKNRPAWNPLIVHVDSVAAARSLVTSWPSAAEQLAAAFWPGPLTLVLRRAPDLPGAHSATGTIAVRIPAHPVARALLQECGFPLAAPSANRSEGVSPTTAEHVLAGMPDVPLVLDGGPCRFGIESTVLSLTGPVPELLRPGALGLRAIREQIGPVALPAADAHQTPASPGMSRRHYAPHAKVALHRRIDEGTLRDLTGPVGLLVHEPVAADLAALAQHVEILPSDPLNYGADLYAALHRLDDAGVANVVVQRPPEGDDWIAIHDRLTRAAA